MPVSGSPFLNVLLGSLLVFAISDSTAWAQAQRSPDTVSLHGAGSTFAAPLYKKWIESYTASHLSISLSYDVVGSGEGVRCFLSDAVDFAGSDEILNDREAAEAGGAIMIPVTAGMVVIAYNVPGVTADIKLPREVYVDIFAGLRSESGTIPGSKRRTPESNSPIVRFKSLLGKMAVERRRFSPIISTRSAQYGAAKG